MQYLRAITLGLYAIHKPLALGLRPRVSGFITLIQTSHLVYNYYIICHQKKIVIKRARDPIYLNFVATDFFMKIISPSAGKNSGDSA